MQDEIRLRCLGTATPASKLVPFAVGMVGRLRQVDQYGYKQVTGENWRIDVKLNGDHAVITIWEDGEVGDVEGCPEYISGMTRVGANLYRYKPDTGAKVEGVYQFKPSPAYAARKKLNQAWSVSPVKLASSTSISGAPSFDASNLAGLPPPWSASGWSQAAYLKPGLYSGKMRHVVQVLLGSKVPVQYQYGFGKTHGIYREQTKNGVVDWLIEISSANGVMAMRLPACKASVPKENALGYVPTGGTFPTGEKLIEALRTGAVRKLLDASALEPVYSKSPFSPMFGWAFSYAGDKASVVVYRSETNYKRTFLYTISLNNSSASLAQEESDLVICAGYNMMGRAVANFKVPTIPMGACYPVDFSPPPGVYAAASCNAPLHVFYKQSGERVVVWYRNGPETTSKPKDNPRPGSWPPNVSGQLNQEYFEYSTGEYGVYTSQINQQIYIEGFAPDQDFHIPNRTRYFASASGGVVTEFSIESGGIYSGSKYLRLKKLLRTQAWTESSVRRTISTSVVIPSSDREAAGYHESINDSIGGRFYSFLTYDVITAYATYLYVTLPDHPGPANFRSDGLLAEGYTTWSGAGTLAPTEPVYVPQFSIPNLDTPDYHNGWTLGSFGGFGGDFNGGSLPGILGFPFGLPYYGTPDGLLAPVMPISGSSNKTNVFDRWATKKLITSAGVYDLEKKLPLDEFSDSPTSPFPDAAWFEIDPVVFLLITTWDGKVGFRPKDLNTYDFSYSDFGSYGEPESGYEYMLNFVGDA